MPQNYNPYIYTGGQNLPAAQGTYSAPMPAGVPTHAPAAWGVGNPGGSSGTTNYFLNGMPIPADQLDAALKALQTPGTTGTPTTTGQPQFDPAASFNAPPFNAARGPAQALPGLNTSGVNPYLQNPIMASYYGMSNPLLGGGDLSQNFYGDPELFTAPTAGGAVP